MLSLVRGLGLDPGSRLGRVSISYPLLNQENTGQAGRLRYSMALVFPGRRAASRARCGVDGQRGVNDHRFTCRLLRRSRSTGLVGVLAADAGGIFTNDVRRILQTTLSLITRLS